MYVPGWFRSWCEAQSLNPERPALWPEPARAAFMAEKLRRFRLHWAWMSKLGQPAIIRQQSGRLELIRQVRRELQDALSPPPENMGRYTHTSPYRKAAAWSETELLAAYEVRTYPDGSRELILPTRPSLAARKQAALDPWRQMPIEEVLAWVERHPTRIGLSETTARCLCWLEKEFATGPGRVTAAGSRLEPNAASVSGPGAQAPALLADAATPR
jgi:hypothetical protein